MIVHDIRSELLFGLAFSENQKIDNRALVRQMAFRLIISSHFNILSLVYT